MLTIMMVLTFQTCMTGPIPHHVEFVDTLCTQHFDMNGSGSVDMLDYQILVTRNVTGMKGRPSSTRITMPELWSYIQQVAAPCEVSCSFYCPPWRERKP